jgi:hypothetical protein
MQLATNHPVVIGTGRRGSLVQVFVVAENIVVEAPSLLSAVDKAFKLHYICGIQFEPKAYHIWQLIQNLVYGIFDGTNTYTGVHDIQDYLKIAMKKSKTF